MPIITTYPFKKDPLNKKDEILISDYPDGLKTKTTDLENLSKFVVANLPNFVFTQSIPSTTWLVSHDLNKFCSVTVVSDSNNVMIGNVTYNSLNQLTITFSAAFSGKAYLN